MRRAAGILLAALLACVAAVPAQAVDPCDPTGQNGFCKVSSGNYRLRLPTGAGPHPAVLYLYGSTGRSHRLAGYDEFVRAFTERGYAVIIPAALDVRYKDGTYDTGWSLRGTSAGKRDELAFLTEVLNDAAARFRIDRNRVLMTGMSMGGFLTWEIACREPRFAAAYAPVAASRIGEAPQECAGPVRLLHMHGRSDEIVGLDAESWGPRRGIMYPALADLMAAMARTNRCTGQRTGRDGMFERTDWQGCRRGSALSQFLHEGGHTIPFAWYTKVIDWFEGAPAPDTPAAGTTPARPAFKAAGDRGGRFKRVSP